MGSREGGILRVLDIIMSSSLCNLLGVGGREVGVEDVNGSEMLVVEVLQELWELLWLSEMPFRC